jgi:hypothetical protein
MLPHPKYFLPYQHRWIMDNSPLKIIQKSRQVGISYSEAYRCLRRVTRVGAKYDVYRVPKPVTTWGGTLSIISTSPTSPTSPTRPIPSLTPVPPTFVATFVDQSLSSGPTEIPKHRSTETPKPHPCPPM